MRLFLAALLFATAAMAGIAPPGHFSFRSFNADQGLENQVVWCLAQDGQGFIWAGTEDGAYRYDGDRFRRFGAADGLPSSFVSSFAVAGGVLWAGTFDGAASWDGTRFLPARGIPRGQVAGLAADPDGAVWIASPYGLFHQRGPDFVRALEGAVSAVWVDPAGKVLYGKDGEVSQLNGRSFGVPAGAGRERIDSIRRDGQGRLWVLSARHLWALRDDRFEDRTRLLPGKSEQGIIQVDRKGSIWVPTDNGILHVDGESTEVLGVEQGLPVAFSRDVLEDREGSRWIASLGLHRVLGSGGWTSYGLREGLPADVVWTVGRDERGALFVGTDQGLAVDQGGRFVVLPGTSGHVVRAVARAAGATWLAGGPGELLRFDGKRAALLPGPPGDNRVLALRTDREGTLWAATDGAGLLRIDARGRLTREPLPGDDPREYLSDLLVDREGRLWAAGLHGIAVRSPQGWRRIDDKDGLRATHVAYLLERKSGEVCVAYFESHGVTCLRLGDRGVTGVRQLDALHGLASDRVYLLGEDARQRLWIGSGTGVDLVDAAGRVEHFGRADGLPGDDCDAQAFLADPDGEVWLGTSTGLGRFQGKESQPPAPPRTAIIEARLGSHAVTADEPAPQVHHRDNTLEARFAALSYVDERRQRFEVRLVGLEDAWHTTDVRQTRYSSLSPGAYRLEVRARIGRGDFGPAAELEFLVLPAWWQTLWFRVLAGLAVLLLVTLMWRLRVQALERSNRVLEEVVTARTAELAAANAALLDLSVTDPLTGLKNRRYLREELPREAARAQRVYRDALAQGLASPPRNVDLLIVIADLDRFKEVNDTYGHLAGDRVLAQAAALLRRAVRETDAVVRYGGEEFLVLYRDADRRDAPALADRVLTLFREHAFDLGEGKTVHRTCSLGIAALPFVSARPDLVDADKVLHLADDALLMAKRAGRDRWVMLAARGEEFEGEVTAEQRIAEGTVEASASGG